MVAQRSICGMPTLTGLHGAGRGEDQVDAVAEAPRGDVEDG
jgi:hypothetical protein